MHKGDNNGFISDMAITMQLSKTVFILKRQVFGFVNNQRDINKALSTA